MTGRAGDKASGRSSSAKATADKPEGLLDRIPPQNLEAEQSTIGSMMIDRGALLKGIEIVRPEDFYRDAHQTIFEALIALADKSEPVDIVTVQEELRAKGALDRIGGTEYLATLIDSTPTAANLEYYAHIVTEKSLLRQVCVHAHDLIQRAHGPVENLDDFLAYVQQQAMGIASGRAKTELKPLGLIGAEVYKEIEAAQEEGRDLLGLRTGFEDLDDIIGGLAAGDLIVAAGGTSIGKTAFVNQVTRNVAKQGYTVGHFSLEMTGQQHALREFAQKTRLSVKALRACRLSEREDLDMIDAIKSMDRLPIRLSTKRGLHHRDISMISRAAMVEYGLDLIVVDYLQLVKGDGYTRNEQVGNVAEALKNLAGELNLPILAVCAINRESMKANEEPQLWHLRESGEIEYHMDVGLFLHKPDKEHMTVIVRKGRNIETGRSKLKWHGRTMEFGPDEPEQKELTI